MVRTVIALAKNDKDWLDRQAQAERVPMTEIVRRAVAAFRAKQRHLRQPFDELLEKTSGIWRGGDGLSWQRKIREEWD